MKNIFIKIGIIQEKKFTNIIGPSTKKLRLNPLNPLTYLFIVISFLYGLLIFGFVGIWKEMDFRNPFKYQ
jgi:hypothetical protein